MKFPCFIGDIVPGTPFQSEHYERAMRRIVVFLLYGIFAFSVGIHAQVATNTGSIYGKVVDEKRNPLSGVSVNLNSDVIPTVSATTGSGGSFRFASLPPGNYSALFSQPGFTEIRQEGIRITVGTNIELEIILKPSPEETLTVIGETPLLDLEKRVMNQSTHRNIWKISQEAAIHGSF